MKKTKKYLAFALATGLMLSSMTVFAEEAAPNSETPAADSAGISNQSQYSGGTVIDAGDYKQYEGSMPGSADNVAIGDYWWDPSSSTMKQWDGSAWTATGCDSSSSASSTSQSSETDRISAERAKEGAQIQAEAEADGFVTAAQMQYAKEAGKSAGEFFNNAVVTTPGIENATPVAQGGKLVINGKVTNATASISKVSVAFADSAKSVTDGTVLNVVDVWFPSVEATINFYMPGVTDGASITALQYENGTWVNVEVAEVRADHVTLNLKGNGVVAFIAK